MRAAIAATLLKDITRNQLIDVLRDVGVQAGDGLLVHAAIQFLGRPVGGAGMYLDALLDAVDPESGTLAAPTFNFAFARGELYDPAHTPSVGMGVLSELIRQHPLARRTTHPMQSLAVIGRFANDLAERDTPSAFDPGSAFDRMVELGFKILLLGADIDAVSLIHYSEQRLGVPYRYWKDFRGHIVADNSVGVAVERTYRMYVRDMDLDPKLTLHPVRDDLLAQGKYAIIQLNYGQVGLISMADFVSAVDRILAADPYSLMLNRPDHPKQKSIS